MDLDELSKIATQIQAFSRYTNQLQRNGIAHQAKADKTVVTKADYFVQAAITHCLNQHTPNVPVLAEETLEGLLTNPKLMVDVDRMLSEVGCTDTAEQLLSLSSHHQTEERYWVLDPIDGTRGFIRGDQYAMALGLVEGREVIASILCCPRLPYDGTEGITLLATASGKLVCLSEVSDVQIVPVSASSRRRRGVLTESLELGPSTTHLTSRLKERMGWTSPTLRMDSQAKYGAIAIGCADIYLRFPRAADALEFSWDHAAGSHILEASGGTVTDLDGRPLDFSFGSLLRQNRGILATRNVDHQQVVQAVNTLE